VNRHTIGRWVAIGRLKGLRTPGGHHRFPEPEIMSLLADPVDLTRVDNIAREVVDRTDESGACKAVGSADLAETDGERPHK
jgi:predicted site-specific integrase-resolvase